MHACDVSGDSSVAKGIVVVREEDFNKVGYKGDDRIKIFYSQTFYKVTIHL